MKKTKIIAVVLLIVFTFTFATSAMAQVYSNGTKRTMYCDRCGKNTTGSLTYIGNVTRTYKNCTVTSGCVIKSVSEQYDWHCDTCGYGGGAHGIEVEVKRYHSSSSCPIGEVSINAKPIERRAY